ncbi:ATP-binding protein [Rhizobium halophytocola]|uniref:ATPase/DNA-binding winged helix-turn-helix (WHTH) protein n=1 Tax=Rhizobium halophytocola TaxID=735519 RepID=A0ABS4E4S8_9HYPH|nr:winged helix-turn-helix domain-containing protein [Rhizobium halophytocola]MBP1852904.1 putative ATPase/DNA-binding winged helix-turn-helix (wHTH) protein [Rhizobium halophytocola]
MTNGKGSSAPRSFQFGRFKLIPEQQLLLRDDEPVRIGGRALDILTALIERPGDLIAKRELLERVWPNTLVEESNLKVNMVALRRVLEDEPGAPQSIATVVGRGYRFIAPVRYEEVLDPCADPRIRAVRNHNLPTTALARILGREEDIRAIINDLRDCRLLSIVGTGGIGKTTVALAIAERLVGSFSDGVWLIDLSTLKDPNLVPSAITTGIGLAAHSANTLAALGEFLSMREMLLVLDNCEHVISGVASTVERLLPEAAGITILATSREPLQTRGERVRRLRGLAVPEATSLLSAQEVLAFPAIQLFVDRATDRYDAFELKDPEVGLVAEICRRLDGIALAIELAATQVEAFSIQALLNQLDGHFRLLEGHRGVIERHRTLTATIDWSYALLSETERAVMRRLATFAGVFSLESACAVAADTYLDHSRVVMDLARLVAKSIVSAEAHGNELRYRMLDTTRAYALKKLAASDEFDTARHRHAEHCIDLLSQAGSDIERLPRSEWLHRHAPKTDDIRNAMRWAFTSTFDPALGVRLTIAALPFGQQVSLIDECRMAAERALDDRFRPYRTARDDLLLNLTFGATLLHTRGPLLEVKAALTKALELAEQIADADLQLSCLRGLSEYELWTGDSQTALALADRIRELESHGDLHSAGGGDAQAGSALSWLGALAASREKLERIVQRPPTFDLRPDIARYEFDQRLTAEGSLAIVLWLQGFPDQAIEVSERQLREAEGSNYAVSLCYALLHGALITAMYIRDYDAAWRHLERGLEHATKHGLDIWKNMGVGAGGRLHLYTGRPLDLLGYRDMLTKVRDGGFRMRYPNYLTNYGEALARQGNVAAGLAAIDEAMEISKSRGQVVGIPEILRIKGNVIRFQEPKKFDRAEDCYRQAIGIARSDGAISWELRSTMSLVKLMRQRGGDPNAEDELAAVYARFREGFSTGDLRNALQLIESRSISPANRRRQELSKDHDA